MVCDTPGQDQGETVRKLPNQVTIVGRGVPASYEISVDGEIAMLDTDHHETATIVSGGTAEGAIDVGVDRFRFSGQLTNVHLVDWNGIEGPDSPCTPAVSVEYSSADR